MINLFIDTTNNNLILILFSNNQVISKLFKKNQMRISDIFANELEIFLKANNINLNKIKNFYVIIGPGSFTGIRIGVSFVKTIWTINKDINVYKMSSLQFQSPLKNSISILDAKGNKSYLRIYDDSKEIEILIENDKVKKILNEYKNYQIFRDYQDIDNVISNFINIICLFKQVKRIEEFNPLYLKELFSN